MRQTGTGGGVVMTTKITTLVLIRFVFLTNMDKQVQLPKGSVFICFYSFLKDYIVDLWHAHLTLL